MTLENLETTTLLKKIQQRKEKGENFFMEWMQDYQTISDSEHQRVFTFVPDGAVTNSSEMIEALYQYADENHITIILEKAGMYPEFLLDGVLYRANRIYTNVYHAPVAMIRCERIGEEKEEITKIREKNPVKYFFVKFLRITWPAIFVLIWGITTLVRSGEKMGLVNVGITCLIAIVMVLLNYFTMWNLKN